MRAARRRRGLTLVELILAMGLFSLLAVALFSLLSTSMELWGRTEQRRDLNQAGAAVGTLLAQDLSALEGGPRGDLLVDWVLLDGDGDEIQGAAYPRLRLVRRATDAELIRLQRRLVDRTQSAPAQPFLGEGLIEVTWALLPRLADAPGAEPECSLWRGERIVGDPETLSMFDPQFFGATGQPLRGMLDEVAAGVLWFGPALAARTTLVDEGWSFGPQPRDAARSWDARRLGRPDVELHSWNEAHSELPAFDGLPLLPRRVRFELELERAADVKRRPRLAADLASNEASLLVSDASKLPPSPGLVRIDEEWLEIRGAIGDEVQVVRGARGTAARPHGRGARLHFGQLLVRELPVPLYREEWDR